MGKTNLRLLGLFLFIIFSWGLAWPINKIGLSFMSPLWFTTVRLIIGTVTMMLVVIAVNKFSLPRFKDIPLIFVIGILQISIYILLASIGLSYIPAGRASLLAYTTPLWVMPISILFFQEKHNLLKWSGLIAAIIGLSILVRPWELNWADKHVLIGTGLLLLASLSWAISMLCVRYMHWTKSPLELIPWQLLIGTIPVFIYAISKEPVLSIHWNTSLILSLIYTGAWVTGISYWISVIVNKEMPTLVMSLGFLAVPVLSLLSSAVFLNEAISAASASAMLLILMGLAFVVV